MRLVEPHLTERLWLRELTHDDAAFVMELVNDPDWIRYIGDRDIHTLEAACGYVDRVRDNGYAPHGFGLWAVGVQGDPVPFGLCGLIRRPTLADVDLGFAFLPRARGKGYAREAALASVRLARERFGLTRLVAISTRDNAASHAVLEAAGLRRQGDIQMEGDAETLAFHTLDLGA